MWQGQRDSNPQPTVLETVALSIALCPYLFDGSHHPCDLYIITNLFGNCKGFLQIFLKKILVQSSGASGKRLNGSCEVNGVVRCVIYSTARSYSILPNGNPVEFFELCTITDFCFLSTEVRNFRDPRSFNICGRFQHEHVIHCRPYLWR